MIPLTPRQEKALKSASKDRLTYASRTKYLLQIGGRDLTRSVKDLRIPDQNGPAVVLEGALGVRLSEDLEQESCRLDYLVDGERLPGFRGKVVYLDATGYETVFLAATPFYDAENTPIGNSSDDDLDYLNSPPSEALYELASRLDYESVEIPRIDTPRITRQGRDAFRWNEYVSEDVEDVEKEAKILLEDTPLSVATARPEVAVIGDSEPVWVFEEGKDFEYRELSVKSRIEGRFAKVVVWRDLKNGKSQKLAEAKVDNGNKKVDPDSVFLLEHTDASTESAHQEARNQAVALAENSHVLEFPCEYVPVGLDRGDPVLVRGREITPTGTVKREYRCRLTSVSPDIRNKKGSLKAIGAQSKEVFEAKPPLRNFRRGDAFRPYLGLDWLGSKYLSARLPGVTFNSDTGEALIDTQALYEATRITATYEGTGENREVVFYA